MEYWTTYIEIILDFAVTNRGHSMDVSPFLPGAEGAFPGQSFNYEATQECIKKS